MPIFIPPAMQRAKRHESDIDIAKLIGGLGDTQGSSADGQTSGEYSNQTTGNLYLDLLKRIQSASPGQGSVAPLGLGDRLLGLMRRGGMPTGSPTSSGGLW